IETARKLIALQNGDGPWGYFALAESLEQKGDYEAVVNELTPAIANFRKDGADAADALALLLPHVAFSKQALGKHQDAIDLFKEAHALAPTDVAITSNLIEAYMVGKQYPAAVALAQDALGERPDDLQLARLQAQALRFDGKADQGVAVIEGAARKH